MQPWHSYGCGKSRGTPALRCTHPRLPDHPPTGQAIDARTIDRKSTRLNSSHLVISYAVFCLKKKKNHTLPKLIPDLPDRCSRMSLPVAPEERAARAGEIQSTFRRWSPGFFFFFNDTATTEIYTLSLHDALPI